MVKPKNVGGKNTARPRFGNKKMALSDYKPIKYVHGAKGAKSIQQLLLSVPSKKKPQAKDIKSSRS